MGTFVDVLLEVPAIGSGVLRMGLVTDARPEYASDLMITFPKQFLKFPDENKAIPTYQYIWKNRRMIFCNYII